MGLATLVGTSAFSSTCYAFAKHKYPDQLTPMDHVQILSIGAFLGLTSTVINKEMEKRSSFFREHKKINLITAGLSFSAIMSSALCIYFSIKGKDHSMIMTALNTATITLLFAPFGIAGALAGK